MDWKSQLRSQIEQLQRKHREHTKFLEEKIELQKRYIETCERLNETYKKRYESDSRFIDHLNEHVRAHIELQTRLHDSYSKGVFGDNERGAGFVLDIEFKTLADMQEFRDALTAMVEAERVRREKVAKNTCCHQLDT